MITVKIDLVTDSKNEHKLDYSYSQITQVSDLATNNQKLDKLGHKCHTKDKFITNEIGMVTNNKSSAR